MKKSSCKFILWFLKTAIEWPLKILIPVLVITYCENALIKKAAELKITYVKQMFNFSDKYDQISSLLEKLYLQTNILYETLNIRDENNVTSPSKSLNTKYENLKKVVDDWKDNFDRNLNLIQNNTAKDEFKIINDSIEKIFSELQSAYDDKKKGLDYNNYRLTISNTGRKIRALEASKNRLYNFLEKEKKTLDKML